MKIEVKQIKDLKTDDIFLGYHMGKSHILKLVEMQDSDGMVSLNHLSNIENKFIPYQKTTFVNGLCATFVNCKFKQTDSCELKIGDIIEYDVHDYSDIFTLFKIAGKEDKFFFLEIFDKTKEKFVPYKKLELKDSVILIS